MWCTLKWLEDDVAAVREVLVSRAMQTPIGELTVVAGPNGLRAVLWPGEDGSRVARSLAGGTSGMGRLGRQGSGTRSPDGPSNVVSAAEAGERGGLPGAASRAQALAEQATVQLGEYFDGTRRGFDVDLDPRGTTFQLAAWGFLRSIPFGAVTTYREQATALGDPARARAVGSADGRNPLSIVVPCHRVVAVDGSLTGFAGGIQRKRWLLEHERRVAAGVSAR